MRKPRESKASQIKQFIIDTKINGDNPVEAYRRIFHKEDVSETTIGQYISRMKKKELYQRMEPAITDSFIQEVTDATKEAAVNYMKKYNSMLEEGDKFIRESDGEMKLKAFANQRTLMEANPFKLVQQMSEASKPKNNELPESVDDIIMD